MIKASKRSLTIGHPLINYFDSITEQKSSSAKGEISLLSGLPSNYDEAYCISEKALEIIRADCLNPSLHGYASSSGIEPLKQEIAKMYGRGHLASHNILVVNNAHIALFFALIAVCKEGDSIAVPDVGYPFFENLAPALGVTLCRYKIRLDKDCQIDLESLAEAVTAHKAKLVYVVNPNNPTGSVFSKAHLSEVYKACERLDTLILADEVYYGQAVGPFTSFADVYEGHPVLIAAGS